MTDREFLLKVRAIIAKGWIQNMYFAGGCACLSGAGGLAASGLTYVADPEFTRGENRLAHLLDFDSYPSLQKWNDAEGRTQQDVLDRIDFAVLGQEQPA